jgi:two-component system, OmpR family, sensor histidine kinase KdpD
MRAKGEHPGRPTAAWIDRHSSPLGLLASVVTVAAETWCFGFLFDHRLRDIVMMYLLGVVILAMRFGYAPSLLGAVLSVGAVDYFFTAPYLSFAVEDKSYILTLVIMLFVAFVISNLMERIRRAAADATQREDRTAKLYAMSQELSIAPTGGEIIGVAQRHLREAFANEVSVLLPAAEGGLYCASAPEPTRDPDAATMARANDVFARDGREEEGPSGDHIFPLRGSTGTLGVLVARPSTTADRSGKAPSGELLGAFVSQIALAIERAQLADGAQRAQIEVQRERLRNALLSSVSHDLRTPLAVVMGAVTALLDSGEELPASRRREYLETISDEAIRLNRLVRNLLDMTALEAGALRIRKSWQPIEEVVGVALNRLDRQLENRPVEVAISPDASMVPFDATLLEHVLLNLVENAVKYAPGSSPIEIHARAIQSGVEVEVADRGPGVPSGQEEQVFEKFHRATRQAGGMGLGLAICRGIVAVHGGRIWCESRSGGGAAFRFVLPREQAMPPTITLPEAAGEP